MGFIILKTITAMALPTNSLLIKATQNLIFLTAHPCQFGEEGDLLKQ